MSPDIDWHVGEGAERETITSSTPARRLRRGWLVVIVVIFGVGLGIAYRSLPDPVLPPTPTPTLSPTPSRRPIPAKLFETIDREAQALAEGDLAIYLEVQHYSSGQTEALREDFTAWGRPGDDRPLYTIVDFDLWKDGRAWADVRQFREGRYFRETRFYYETKRWWRSADPDLILWGNLEESVQTPHFNAIYASYDRDTLSPTLRQLEEDYQALCGDLGCAALGHELTFTVRVEPQYGSPLDQGEIGDVGILLLSPRVAGFFESGRAYGWKNNSTNWGLAQAIAEQLYGTINVAQPGGMILGGSIAWSFDRHDPFLAGVLASLGDLKQNRVLPLEELWEPATDEESGLAFTQAYHLVQFIEQEYGASSVAPLLKALGSAKSLPEAIEAGLGVPFAEFDQKWQAWVKQNIPSK